LLLSAILLAGAGAEKRSWKVITLCARKSSIKKKVSKIFSECPLPTSALKDLSPARLITMGLLLA
jgi:hypothetical protein